MDFASWMDILALFQNIKELTSYSLSQPKYTLFLCH